MQTTQHILMIRPVQFTYNAQTAVNNAFQVEGAQADAQQKALGEFDRMVTLLRDNGVQVTVIDDTPEPHTPDSLFPNNWLSFHPGGTMVLYPMFAPNRRLERSEAIINRMKQEQGIANVIDLSGFEKEQRFLEGTGSMVLDRDQGIAYACLSPRTDKKVLQEFAKKLKYEPVIFHATDKNNKPIYHTNVMMCVADHYVVICLESIRDVAERSDVIATINGTEKEAVLITLDQMNHFAGNMLQVLGKDGEPLLVMSTQAYQSLTEDQLKTLENYNRIIHSDLHTIETNGGGSARCMMAEVF
ncbi:citrulline utilization hydrolase CtlX [Deminuibacter soli]|uniref:Amidinotransferase n=1 Tax=Deminuibacter soli TaxID=2291815 RepID=A0A3E1NES7_9BACT|nr:arginine deiminase-related protein [Deminuibacter soli]RFM26483.1 amidinotransferase [Deminuibacter soli]